VTILGYSQRGGTPTYSTGIWRAGWGGGGGTTGGGQARRAGGHPEERGRDDAAGRGDGGKKPLDPRCWNWRGTGEVGGRSRAALAAAIRSWMAQVRFPGDGRGGFGVFGIGDFSIWYLVLFWLAPLVPLFVLRRRIGKSK